MLIQWVLSDTSARRMVTTSHVASQSNQERRWRKPRTAAHSQVEIGDIFNSLTPYSKLMVSQGASFARNDKTNGAVGQISTVLWLAKLSLSDGDERQ